MTEENKPNQAEEQLEENRHAQDSFDDYEAYKPEKSFSALKVVLYTLLTLLIIGLAAVGGAAYYVHANLQPADPESDELIQIEVPMGSSATRIASLLADKGIIKHEQVFYYYVRYNGHSGFQAGEYHLSPSMEIDDIIEMLKSGRIYLEVERFTVPEGFAIEQMAVHLESQGLVNAERFLEVVREADFSDIEFLQHVPDHEDRKYRLEGLLFPNTYEVYKGADEEHIVRTMLVEFDKQWNRLVTHLDENNPGWREKLEEQDLSFYDVVTLASIIEREAVVSEERSTIAGVFHNRIKDGWLLQSCATVQFVLGKQRDRLLFEDLEVESPYNTYINPGLPPGPIASPGYASLYAAISPEDHDFYFFVTKKDGSGAHHFARTYQEHLNNDAQSRGNF